MILFDSLLIRIIAYITITSHDPKQIPKSVLNARLSYARPRLAAGPAFAHADSMLPAPGRISGSTWPFLSVPAVARKQIFSCWRLPQSMHEGDRQAAEKVQGLLGVPQTGSAAVSIVVATCCAGSLSTCFLIQIWLPYWMPEHGTPSRDLSVQSERVSQRCSRRLNADCQPVSPAVVNVVKISLSAYTRDSAEDCETTLWSIQFTPDDESFKELTATSTISTTGRRATHAPLCLARATGLRRGSIVDGTRSNDRHAALQAK